MTFRFPARHRVRGAVALSAALFAGLMLASPASPASPAAMAADVADGLVRVGLVQGSGRVTTENRTASGFQAVELRGSMDLVLRQAGREGVELRGDDNLLPMVETRVVDRAGVPTLEIGMRRGEGDWTRHKVVVTVDLKTLAALKLSGSGDVAAGALKTPLLRVSVSGSGNLRMTQLDTNELSASVSGSGDLAFAGRSPRTAFSIAGSGDIDAAALEADDVSVRIAGSGDAQVSARKTLVVSIAGSGDVTYSGDPSVKSSIAGNGSVHKR